MIIRPFRESDDASVVALWSECYAQDEALALGKRLIPDTPSP